MGILRSSEWYKNWFNSPYYHILYKHRDEKEAELFIDNLIEHLKLPAGANVEDVCCGKGRHSIYLNKKGFKVTGIDLSEESIKHASRFKNETLSFYLHDMRDPFRENYFDAALNLFTSFGYFENDDEEIQALTSINNGLKKNGIIVIDYFNASKVLAELPVKESKNIDNILFTIEKKLLNGFILKTIEVKKDNQQQSFKEKVKILELTDFKKLFEKAGFKLISTFGNYKLSVFNEKKSERLIVVGAKKQ